MYEQYKYYDPPPQPIYLNSQQQQQGMNPMQMYNMYNKFSGNGNGTFDFMGGGNGGGLLDALWSGGEVEAGTGNIAQGSSGLSGMGMAAVIAAIIAGQHSLTLTNDRKTFGHETGDLFSTNDNGDWTPHIMTEPWFAFMSNQWGMEPTPGEKFDAAMWGDNSEAPLQYLPSAAGYWGDPVSSWGSHLVENQMGPEMAALMFPVGYFPKIIENWF